MDIALDFMIPADSNYLLFLIPEIIKNNIFFFIYSLHHRNAPLFMTGHDSKEKALQFKID